MQPSAYRIVLALGLAWMLIAPLSAGVSLGVCIPGNNEGLSSDGCRCSGLASAECIGSCVNEMGILQCSGASVADPPACRGLNDLRNLSPNGCPCAVNGDCSGNCVMGSCSGGSSAPICLEVGNLTNISADGCPCMFNGDCAGSCNQQTKTCGGVVGAVFNQVPSLSATASNVVLLGQPTIDVASLSNFITSESTVVFSLYGPNNSTCAGPAAFVSTHNHFSQSQISSNPYVPPATGIYRWRVLYAGNAWNESTQTSCLASTQRVVVDLIVFASGFE